MKELKDLSIQNTETEDDVEDIDAALLEMGGFGRH